MTIDLEQSLTSFKEQINWNDDRYASYRMHEFVYDGPKLPALINETYTIEDMNGFYRAFHSLEFLYMRLGRLPRYKIPDLWRVRREMMPFVSEVLSNILQHGGDDAKANPTLIEHYIPENSGLFIVRFSNEHAVSWDPKEVMEHERGRGGFSAYRYKTRVVTFENGGRDLVALVLPG